MEKPSFFSLDLKQPVNQWLGIALVSVMCFWVVIFYVTHQTEEIANAYVSNATGIPKAAHPVRTH